MPLMPEFIEASPVRLVRCRSNRLPALVSAIERSQPELARWLPWAEPMPTVDAERSFIDDRRRAFENDEDYGYFLVEDDTDELVGGCGLSPKDDATAEIGYWVRTDRTGRGYATAGVRALTVTGFLSLPNVDRIVIRMDRANKASAAIPPKAGYVLDSEYELRDVHTVGRTGKGLVWAYSRRTWLESQSSC